MRRLTTVLTLLTLVLAPACAKASPQQRIAQAVSKTQDAGSARIAMTMEMTGGAQGLSVTAEGALEFATQNSTFTMDFGEMAAQAGMGKIEMVTQGQTIYMKFPDHEQLGLPTPWLKMDLDKMEGVQGMESLSRLNNDPARSMEMLRGASDDVGEVGTEDVRGVSTTHYKATVDLDKAIENVPEEDRAEVKKQFDTLGVDTVPTEVWIDEEGLLRRQRSTVDLSKAEGAAAGGGQAPTEMMMEIELYDFGAEVDVEPPPADETTDFADLQGAGG